VVHASRQWVMFPGEVPTTTVLWSKEIRERIKKERERERERERESIKKK